MTAPGRASMDADPTGSANPGLPAGDRRLRWAALVLLAGQAVAMFAFSWVQYRRYSLTNDFGGYAQAWSLIGHGHLNPYVSVFRGDFLHNNLDLALYPVAALGRILPYPVMLSWSQDLAVVGTEAVTLFWVGDVLRAQGARLGRFKPVLFMALAVLLAANPWSWETIAFSLHFEAAAAFFAVLAGRDLYRGRYRALLVWVPLAMAAESLGSLYVIVAGAGVLLSRSASRSGRRVAAGVVGAGVAGLVVVSQLGLVGRSGTTTARIYRYLLPGHPPHAGALSVLSGVLAHPGAAASMLASHLPYVAGYVAAAGTLGLGTSFGLVAVAVIIVPNALSSELSFIAFPGAFQSWPAQPFLIVGTTLVLVSLTDRLSARADGARTAAWLRRLLAVMAAPALTLSALELATMPTRWLLPSPAAAQLARIDRTIPNDSEVVADQNIIGRLAQGRVAYDYVHWGDRVPIDRRRLFIVFKRPSTHRDLQAVSRLQAEFPGAALVEVADDWLALVAQAPVGQRTFTVG